MASSFPASAFLASALPADAVGVAPRSGREGVFDDPEREIESALGAVVSREGPAVVPLYLGPDDVDGAERFSAWWHPAADLRGPASIGVVLCSAFGREELSSHQSLRSLALQLAAAGVTCLRFDYPGTGDSGGSELAPDAVERWLKSIDVAASTLQSLSGVRHLVLLGLRAGALLAAHAASRRRDVVGMACWMPALNGRTLLRELRLLGQDTSASTPGIFESGGHAMSDVARERLQGLDVRRLTDVDVPRWLVLERDDMADPQGIEAWVEQLRHEGSGVAYERLPGYAAMMLDPHHSRVPTAWCEATLIWIQGLAHALRDADRTEAVVAQMLGWSPSTRAGREALGEGGGGVLRLGTLVERQVRVPLCEASALPAGLSGVWTEPAMPVAGAEPRSVLLINAGSTRRIGPGRLYVKLARDLAQAGHTVLRLDLSGLGESGVRPGQCPQVTYPDTGLDEVLQAVAHLHATRGRPVQVVGLCAGAFHALQASVRAVREGSPSMYLAAPVMASMIGGVLAINPLTFRTPSSGWLAGTMASHKVVGEMQRYKAGLWSWSRWKRLLSGQVSMAGPARVVGLRLRSWLQSRERDWRRWAGLARADDVGQQLLDVQQAHIDVGFVFSERDPGAALLRTEVGSALARLRGRGMAEIPVAQADHTFTQWAWREALSREVQAWVARAG